MTSDSIEQSSVSTSSSTYTDKKEQSDIDTDTRTSVDTTYFPSTTTKVEEVGVDIVDNNLYRYYSPSSSTTPTSPSTSTIAPAPNTTPTSVVPSFNLHPHLSNMYCNIRQIFIPTSSTLLRQSQSTLLQHFCPDVILKSKLTAVNPL